MSSTQIFMEDENTWIGRYVYLGYKPQKIGQVKEILPKLHPPHGFKRVRIKWETGEETIGPVTTVSDFLKLIEDHKRKVTKHQEHLEKAVQKIAGQNGH